MSQILHIFVTKYKEMAKQLKIWNGRGHGKYNKYHIYLAAYSVKQATELLSKACEAYITSSEINKYYSKNCWGNSMNGIEPVEPCVYVQWDYGFKRDDKPIRII